MKKKTINKIYSTLILSLVVVSAHCQFSFKEKVAKNILAYHIKYGIDTELGLYKGKIKKPDYIYRLIPMKNLELVLYISQDTTLQYPDKNFKLYRVENPGFSFKMPDDKVIKQNNFHTFLADRNYLVAYNPKSENLKFISGNMFLSPIENDFSIKSDDPGSFYNYLVFRYYNFKLKDLKFYKKKKKNYLYKAYSESIGEEVLITVNLNEIGCTEIALSEEKIFK